LGVMIWNIAYFIAWVDLQPNPIERYINNDLKEVQTISAMMEIIFVAAVPLASISNYLSTCAKAQHNIEAKILNGEMGAMTRLLDLTCDVVLELDADAHLAEDEAKLAAMLTLPSDKVTKGTPLTRFMPATDDHRRFEEALSRCKEDSKDGSLPGTLQIKLRSSMGSNIAVELFFVHFYGLDGNGRYLVGVHEINDKPLARLKQFNKKKKRRTKPKSGAESDGSCSSDGGVEDELPKRMARAKGTKAHVVSQMLAEPMSPTGSDTESAHSEEADVRMRGEGDAQPGHPYPRGSRPTKKQLMLPICRETQAFARDNAIVEEIASWNLRRTLNSSCCPFHFVVIELRNTVKRLEAWDCRPDYMPSAEAQCMSCGLLAAWKGELSECRGCLRETVSKVSTVVGL